jgi:hypothetical protein
MAVPTFPLLQMFIQVLTSQFTASAGGAETKDSPQTSIVDKIASDNRRIMDDLPQIKIFEKWCALLNASINLSKAKSFVNSDQENRPVAAMAIASLVGAT